MKHLTDDEKRLLALEDIEATRLSDADRQIMDDLCERRMVHFELEDDRGFYYRTHEGWKLLQQWERKESRL